MKPPRWTTVAESEFAWEREALDWLREKLPDTDPWLAWSNFEFIDDEGKINEVDLLVLAPGGLFLVEIKSRPGVLTGDAHTWTWVTDGREFTDDNPLYLANRKAKRLAALLRRQPSFVRSRERFPWIEPAIFLSSTSLKCKLEGNAAAKVYQRGRPGAPDDDGIVAALHAPLTRGGDGAPARVESRQARAIAKAIAEAGIRPSNKNRRVGDYVLERVVAEGVNYQDWAATHTVVGAKRRIRVYGYGAAASPEARAALSRQARREFNVLEGIDSPGIVKLHEYKETEFGPALIFESDAGAQRLDRFLQRRGAQLDIGTRLQILRDLAETLAYAHKRRLYHRALTPSSVLVRETHDARKPLRVQVMNWQTGAREAGESGATLHTTGTLHVSEYVDDASRVYLAPEALLAGAGAGATLDVFSLGAIAFLVLSGRPPAADAIELSEALRRDGALQLSNALDGASKSLQDLVEYSTKAQVSMRIGSAEEFLEYLDAAEEELTAPTPEATVDPSQAKAGDRIAGGFTVVRRLATTATSDVLLVKRDGADEELVLKVASDARDNDRVAGEGETLRALRHPNIVEFRDLVQVNGRTGLLMRRAGEKSLAKRLREEGRLSPDLLRRFGEELLGALDYLEQQGVVHRDIKPDNIGIAPVGERGALHLVLFDFSLSRAPADNIQAGTRDYLDPFLQLPGRRRWDLYAERYAAAVTLYEMATGTLPQWGDGRSAPELLEDEITLAPQAFDPNLRDGLLAFFAKALRRDYRQRFDNAEEMLRAWRRVFDEARAPATAPDALEAIAVLATPHTTIAELGFSVDAQNVLERMGVHSLRELLAVDRVRFRYLASVADKTRKEIRNVAGRLAQLRPDLTPGGAPPTADEDTAPRFASIDELAALLLPARPAGDDRPEERAMALYLGIEEDAGLPAWAPLGEAARAAGIARTPAAESLLRLRARWLKTPQITAVRDDLARQLEQHGGVMTATEAARALLAERGSAEQEETARLRLAGAVVRAAAEAEESREAPRFHLHGDAPPLLVREPALADYALRLGEEADRIASAEPLLSPASALAALEEVEPPQGVVRLAPQRLLRLAVAASRGAALSSRGEIYPVGMSALRAVRQSLGALVGPQRLSVAEVERRVKGRYPMAGPLPARPTLDALLQEAGAALVWQEASGSLPAGYAALHAPGLSVGSTTHVQRQPTATVGAAEVTEEIAAARAFEEKLRYLLKHGGFLALTAPLKLAPHAQRELVRRFGLQALSLDELLIDAMIATAQALNVQWNVVLAADRAKAGSTDWRNLLRLAARAAEQVAQSLAARAAPVLLTEPGLLARYELMSLVQTLQNESGRPGKVPATVLLVPTASAGTPPVIDGVAVPVVTAAQWAAVPESWVANLHRARATAG